MTVRREANALFTADQATVANSVRNVLRMNRSYKDSIELNKDSLFKTNVKPKIYYLGTDMFISLKETPSGTLVNVEAKSQRYIIGDRLNTYSKLIIDFLRSLENELGEDWSWIRIGW